MPFSRTTSAPRRRRATQLSLDSSAAITFSQKLSELRIIPILSASPVRTVRYYLFSSPVRSERTFFASARTAPPTQNCHTTSTRYFRCPRLFRKSRPRRALLSFLNPYTLRAHFFRVRPHRAAAEIYNFHSIVPPPVTFVQATSAPRRHTHTFQSPARIAVPVLFANRVRTGLSTLNTTKKTAPKGGSAPSSATFLLRLIFQFICFDRFA